MKKKNPNLIDMTGWVMKEHGVPDSKWTVVSYSGKQKWLSRCECGREKEVDGRTLRYGLSKSCGLCSRVAHNLVDETGNKYGYLTVLGPSEHSAQDGHKKWICQCKCGNTCEVTGKQLRNGHTSSCGCLQREDASERRKADLVGKQFSKLIVLELGYTNELGEQIWKCKCDCGNITYASTHNLNSGSKKSCGCLVSAGENKIEKILQENNINYKKQYIFKDLKRKGYLKFDFAIFKNQELYCLIEYQGSQHFDEACSWYPGESDKMKKEYCEEKGISLIEIPYTDYKKIDYNYLKERCKL